MSRYEELFYKLRARVRPEMTPDELERLAEPLERLNQREAAIARAYKICGCGAEYSEAQWANLLPVPGRKWQLDPLVREEWRECADCFGPLAVLERNGQPRPPGTIAVAAVSKSYHCCGNGACLLPIKPGQMYVERWDERSGARAAVGRWAFCSKDCEAW